MAWYIHKDEQHKYTDAQTGEQKTSREHMHVFVIPEIDGKLNGRQLLFYTLFFSLFMENGEPCDVDVNVGDATEDDDVSARGNEQFFKDIVANGEKPDYEIK